MPTSVSITTLRGRNNNTETYKDSVKINQNGMNLVGTRIAAKVIERLLCRTTGKLINIMIFWKTEQQHGEVRINLNDVYLLKAKNNKGKKYNAIDVLCKILSFLKNLTFKDISE